MPKMLQVKPETLTSVCQNFVTKLLWFLHKVKNGALLLLPLSRGDVLVIFLGVIVKQLCKRKNLETSKRIVSQLLEMSSTHVRGFACYFSRNVVKLRRLFVLEPLSEY